jgi:hypothetical protein
MMFLSWADYLCGYEGAGKREECSSDLWEQFLRESIPLEHPKGEEAILFMGITSNGAPLFLHHIIDLGSTRPEANTMIVALASFQKLTTVVGITTKDCFRHVPSKEEDTIKVLTFAKLALATTALAFKTAAKTPPSRP